MNSPIYHIPDTCMGDFTIWPVEPFYWPETGTRDLVQVTLGNGDDCWTRLTPDELPALANHLEQFAAALRSYHAQISEPQPTTT